jgi:colanic acid/amylovoran biosynthesis glycosyltransferase
MKIMYLLRYYPALTETFVAEEMRGLQAAGIPVEVAALGTRADGKIVDTPRDLRVHAVPRRPWAGRMSRASAGQKWLRLVQRNKDAARLPWLRERIAGFDRIHVHFAGEAAEMAMALHMDTGIPFSVTVHAADLFKPRPAMRAVLNSAQSVITISSHNQATLAHLGVNAHLVRCGPDLTRLRPKPFPAGPLRALFVGRDVPKKGLDTLLEAWSQLERPDAELVLLSPKRRGAQPPGVVCMGLVPHREVQAQLARCHLLVAPARRAADGDMDGIPVALMEALATARPVLTCPISGIPELVDSAVAWMVPSDDPRALRNALRKVADDLNSAQRRGSQGPQRLRERGYDLQSQVNGLIEVWQKHEEKPPNADHLQPHPPQS